MIYWTKRIKVHSEEFGEVFTNDFEVIKESDSDFVEDGDGFEINMNGISYEDYLKDTSKYVIEKGVLNCIPLEMVGE